MPPDAASTPVYIEAGAKRVFACSLEWPGWCRSAKTEAQALENLAAYASRYLPVAEDAGCRNFPGREPSFAVVERLTGNATTDFGAPACIPARDRNDVEGEEAERLALLVAACWRVLQRVVESAPEELRKGPRGGG